MEFGFVEVDVEIEKGGDYEMEVKDIKLEFETRIKESNARLSECANEYINFLEELVSNLNLNNEQRKEFEGASYDYSSEMRENEVLSLLYYDLFLSSNSPKK